MAITRERRRGGGGRNARLAAKLQPVAPSRQAIWPGMPGGRYRPLSPDDIGNVIDTAFDLLETIGMGQATPTMIDIVTKAGGTLGDDGRLRFPRALVEAAIETADKAPTAHGFDPARDLTLADERVHFSTAGAAVLYLDPGTRRFRPSVLTDLYDMGRLVDRSDNIHFFARTCVARDLEDARELDLNTAYAAMAATTKPIGVSFFHPDHVYEAVQMFDMALGGEGRFRERPFCWGSCTFVVPPMRYAEDSCECLYAMVRAGMPVKLLSAGQAGATSPAALGGALVQGLAECLSGLTFVNLISPGHPAIVCLWPFVSDLRTGAMSGGSGEEALLNAAAAQVVNALSLPSGVSAGMADSKLPDLQAGYEKGVTITLAAQAGANMIYESAGMLGSLMACSPETLVSDNELLGSVGRTIRGIDIDTESLSRQAIMEVITGEGHFLGHDQTLRLMQTEYIYPEIGDRLSPKDWEERGATDMRERAADRVREVLSGPCSEHLDRNLDSRIRQRFPIRLDPRELDGTGGRW
ncbi:MAG: methyltransferase [Rhodospirillaceae bacterium]|nr:methyltransferase [Rhodospirillaceae bacterium]MBT6139179.1 methyltransferase [Rhodospirillaceae bacterium]